MASWHSQFKRIYHQQHAKFHNHSDLIMDPQLLNELFSFLSQANRPDLQLITLENILALTGSSEGLELICQSQELLGFFLFHLKQASIVSQKSALILVNVSAYEKGPAALLGLPSFTTNKDSLRDYCIANPIEVILKCIIDADSDIADPCCMILSNITRPKQHTEIVIDFIEKSSVTLEQIINVFTKNKYNNKKQKLYYLGPVLSNLSQSPTVRRYILDKSKCVIQRLLPFTEFKDSLIKRGGVVGTLRNCCFEPEYHEWLLSDQVDILPHLLLPLADNTEFDDEDNEKLPPDLQYLPDDKVREADPDIRCMLLEAITQLCAVRENREYVRNKNAYVILRELHKWEKDKKALLACENLVDILIRTEDEIGQNNLKDLEVPPHLSNTFNKMDQEYLQDS